MDRDTQDKIRAAEETLIMIGHWCETHVCDCGINGGLSVADVGGLPPFHDLCDCTAEWPGLAILAGDEIE